VAELVKRPKAKQKVILKVVPPGLLDNLPAADQRAIRAAVGKPVRLNEYDSDGRAELEFIDKNDVIHFVYVDPKFIEPC
jgi:hypothetical protein